MHAWSDKLEPWASGKKAPMGGLSDLALLDVLQRYRRTVAKRYRVVDFDQIEKQLPQGKLWVSAKLDGELWFLCKRDGDVALCTFNGRVLHGTPLVAEAAKLVAGCKDLVVAGELVGTPKEGRPRVGHVGKALGSEDLEKTLSFHPFDLVEEDGQSGLMKPYADRLARLQALFAKGKRVQLVTTVEGEMKDALSYYREWVATQKFEGIVVRGEQGLTYKIKPTFSIDAVVVAFGARTTETVTQVRELTVALRRDDGSLQIVGPVGNGLTEEDRIAWYERLTAMECASSFRMANRDGTLCRFVRPEIVVEIRCTDLIETDADDAPVVRMTLTYGDAEGYQVRGDARCANMLFPVFLRERTDKTPDVASIGLSQITSRLPIEVDQAITMRAELPAATVVKRGVWIKGETAVRKYVVLETNRGPGHAPFAVFFTDFSGGRKTPLEPTLRVASTLEHAQRFVDAWIVENVKKGWLEVGSDGAVPPPPEPAKKPAKKAKEAKAEGAEEAPAEGAAAPEEAPKKKGGKKK